MGFPALNAAAHRGNQNRVRETLEAQESRIANTYATGLRLAEEGRRSEALMVFEQLFNETLIHTGSKAASISAASASQLRYLVLRNLANLLAGEDVSAPRALSFYAQALMLDNGDSVVWNHMGTLAAELGRWGVARMVFEHGLQQHPKHSVMAEKLVEVLMQLGDWQAAQPALARMLAEDSTHPRALQLYQAAKLARTGTVRELPVSPFQKRAAAPDVSNPKEDGPLVLIVSCPTWGALLQTLITALADPRQLQGQAEHQSLHGIDLQLPSKRSSGLLTEGSEDEIDIMMVDSAPVNTQLLDQPERAEQSLAVGGGSSQADPTDTSENVPAVERIEQARVQHQEPQQAMERSATDAGRPLPARVSRRLEARREGHHADADDAGEEEDVNIIAELRPFLPHEPPLIERNPFRADEAPVPDMQSTASALSGVPDAVAEAQAVKAYLAANGRASSLYAAGIALLSAMPQEHRQRWTKGTAEQALALASALGSAWRPEGELALTLAELGLDAAEAVAEGRAQPLPGQQRDARPKTWVGSDILPASTDKKAKAASRRKGAEQSAVAKLLARSEECLGHYLMTRILHDSEGVGATQEHAIRHLWALARTAEMRRTFGTAAKHYAACLKQLQEWESQRQGPACQSIRLPHFSSGLVISASVAQARLDSLKSHQVMETAKAHFECGRADLVVAELRPLLLDEAGVAGKGPLSRPKSILEGLQVLQDAAVVLKDASCELKCRLVALKWLLPPIPTHICDLAAHSAPGSGPPPAVLEDLQKPFRSIAVQAMADLAEFVAAQSRAGDLASLAASAAPLSGLLQHVQWQAAVLLEATSWSLCGTQSQPARHSNKTMSTKTTARQTALLAACMGFCAMHQLRLASQPATLQTIAQEERALAVTASFLARRAVLDLQRGAFVRLALGRFSHALSVLRTLMTDGRAAKEELVLRLNSNLARCLQLLFGVTLPERNMEWGAAHGEVIEDLGLQCKEECIEAWQHLGPYAESLKKDSKALSRLQGVLKAIQKYFKAPPRPVLSAWDPLKLLDSMPFDRADVYSSANSSLIEQLLQQPGELQTAVADDTHAAIHGSLHRLLDAIKPDIDAALKFGEGLSLEDKGAELAESVASLASYDLRYNPRSLRSWDSLANTYKEAASNILNEAAQAYSAGEFCEREDLKARFATYQQRALWASLAARQVAVEASMTDDVAILDEQVGNILYEELQNAPPFSDQLFLAVDPLTRVMLVRNAAQAYKQAWSGLPDEWLYACYSGKLQAKLGSPCWRACLVKERGIAGAAPEGWLSCMAKAVHLSVLHVGGLVEPFYQLHSQRLKLLLKAQPTLAELQAVSRYCSQVANANEAAAVFSSSVAGDMSQESALNKVKHILLGDCIAAMRFCLECDKQYHKASFQIGRALTAQGWSEEAVQQLQGLFSARNRFSINIWEIQGGSQAKSPTPSKASPKGAMSADTDDSLWGRQPGTMSGNGLDETYRKFAAARRKYLLLYFELLQSTERFDVLLAGHAFLQSTVWGSPAMMADLARIALARCVTGAANRLMQHRAKVVDPSPLQPGQPLEELLQLCFTLHTEHLLGPEAGISAADALSALPDTPQAEQEALAWALEEGFGLAAQHWVMVLGNRGEIIGLQDLLTALRKHFKMLRSAPAEVQALVSFAAANMALAIDRSLTRLGAPPYDIRTSSAAVQLSETGGSIDPSSTLAASATSGQQPAPSALAAAPAVPAVASAPAPASQAAPATSAVPATRPAEHAHLLQRLDLSPALVATLVPHMPLILLHLLPGNDGERRMLHSFLLSGYDLVVSTSPLVQQLKAAVQRNALACMQLLSAASGQVMNPGSAAAPAAVEPAATQAASSSQGPAMHISMAELSQQSQGSAALPGEGQAADRSGAFNHDSQQAIAAAPARSAPVGTGEDMCAEAASVDLAMQTASVPQQHQEADGAVPEPASPAAKGRQGIETLPDMREEAYELMRFSRFLHKIGMSKLPEQQDQTPTVQEGLAKVDGNMVRAYLLYLRTAGLESKIGPSIRAVDAATGYEELAKALKQASPAKAAKSARERAVQGVSTDREEVGDAVIEARLNEDGHQLPAKRRRKEPATHDA